MQESVRVIRSERKTVSVEITKELEVLVRAPRLMPTRDIYAFLEEKHDWIEKNREKIRKRLEEKSKEPSLPRFTIEELDALADRAAEVIPERASTIAKEIGVCYKKITIRNQLTRWGSCSSKGNLNFNCLLMLCPEETVDYVIIHELCHLKEMNHSSRFWALVEEYCPRRKEHIRWLKENGSALIARMR